jgi:tetratricopeptide (TPR) repeat protein
VFASELLVAEGRYQEALRHLEVILAAHPDDPDVNARAAAVRRALGAQGQALKAETR